MKAASMVALLCVALLGGIFLLHGSTDHLLFAYGAAVVCVILLALAWLTKKRGKVGFSRATACTAALVSCVWLSYYPGVLFYRSQIGSTKQKLAAVFVSLEETRRLKGAYPERIDELLEGSRLPWLTRRHVVYHSRADYFWLYFRDVNSGLMDIFIYDSDAKAWSYKQR